MKSMLVICNAILAFVMSAMNTSAGEDNNLVKINLYDKELAGPDILVTLPDGKKFRALIPEFINGYKGMVHVVPSEWAKNANGGLTGKLKLPEFMNVLIILRPGKYFIDVTLEYTNTSSETLNNLFTDICFDFKGAMNTDFLPEVLKESRSQSGEYFFSKVASAGALVLHHGKWIKYKADKKSRQNAANVPDIPVLICKSLESDKFAFQMWDKPLSSNPWINYENACMHLMPALCESLAPGKTIKLHGKMGISSNGIEEIEQLYKKL